MKERLDICKRCEFFVKDRYCQVLKDMFPGYAMPMYRAVQKPTAGCPVGKWLPTVFSCPKCSKVNEGHTCSCGMDFYQAFESSRLKHAAFLYGVGTELKNIIPEWFRKDGCGCDEYANTLNVNGVDWCIEHKQEIIDHLVEKASEYFLGTVTSFNAIVASYWVNKAIRRAQKNLDRERA